MHWMKLGQIEIGRVVESVGPFMSIFDFFPDASNENLAPHRHWLEPGALEPGTDRLIMPIQSYVVRTPHFTVLVDSCVGNHKQVPWFPAWDQRSSDDYLDAMRDLGISPADIDYVLCTHLHVDHSGWNTRLVDGRWQPTFPNARYVLSRVEVEHAERMWQEHGDLVWVENVQPILEAGQAELVADDHALDDRVCLEPTPGHTPGHCAVRLRDGGSEAVISGDLIHSPIQCTYPQWNFKFDADKATAATTRRRFLEHCCESGAHLLTAHFPLPSGGLVRAHEDAFRIDYRGW